MHAYEAHNFNSIYAVLAAEVLANGKEVKPRGTVTKELHPAIIEVQYPQQRLVTAHNRPINVAFALAEVLWILQARRDVEMLSFYNSNIKQFSDDGEMFNAPYGYRLRVNFGHDQLEDVAKTLANDPDSRQATLAIWDPWSDRGYSHSGEKNPTKDRACNVLSHLMIRDGALDWLQIVRSNDLMWGTPYNWMQFTHLQEYVASWVGVPVGKFIHVADSLHIYDYHYEEAAQVEVFNLYHEFGGYQHEPLAHNDVAIQHCAEWEEALRLKGADLEAILKGVLADEELGAYWQQVLAQLVAHAHYLRHEDELAYGVMTNYCDAVYAAAQCRFYAHMRWNEKNPTIVERIKTRWEMQPKVQQWILNLDVSVLTRPS